MKIQNLIEYLDQQLQAAKIKDYCPNGLQIAGKNEIKKIICGVTASQDLIDLAVAKNADAILVHHGFFWKNEPPQITGMKQRRIKALLGANINLIAYHLPLDVHPIFGNNAQLAAMLGIENLSGLEPGNPFSIPMAGTLKEPISGAELAAKIEQLLNRKPLWIDGCNKEIRKIGICSGGG